MVQGDNAFEDIKIDEPVGYQQPVRPVEVEDKLPEPQPISDIAAKSIKKRKPKVLAGIIFTLLMLVCLAIGAVVVWYFIFDADVKLLNF